MWSPAQISFFMIQTSILMNFMVCWFSIGFMGDTYDKSKVKDSKISETRFRRMQLFLEFSDSWGEKKRDRVWFISTYSWAVMIEIQREMNKYIHLFRSVEQPEPDWEGHTLCKNLYWFCWKFICLQIWKDELTKVRDPSRRSFRKISNKLTRMLEKHLALSKGSPKT